jgi:hypothetical protein
MPADYRVIDANGALVSSGLPYSKLFFASRSTSESPLLLLWVKTGYSTSASAASIRINGTEVDKIYPRPWTVHEILDLEAISVPFPSSLLATGLFGLPGVNTLTIVPRTGATDYVFVDNVMFVRRF